MEYTVISIGGGGGGARLAASSISEAFAHDRMARKPKNIQWTVVLWTFCALFMQDLRRQIGSSGQELMESRNASQNTLNLETDA